MTIGKDLRRTFETALGGKQNSDFGRDNHVRPVIAVPLTFLKTGRTIFHYINKHNNMNEKIIYNNKVVLFLNSSLLTMLARDQAGILAQAPAGWFQQELLSHLTFPLSLVTDKGCCDAVCMQCRVWFVGQIFGISATCELNTRSALCGSTDSVLL